jgi:hypothetical protein
MSPKPKSKAQARFFGAVAGGQKKVKGMTKKEAKQRLRGTKVKKLPARKKKS